MNINIQDKNLLSIGKLAKLTDVTIETLRHYDKVGILKPDFVDPQTNYRYYSIIQYYELALILEMREIGMSIEDIKNYMNNRTIQTSLKLFEEQSKQTKLLIKKLKKIDNDISTKLRLLKQFKDIEQSEDLQFKHINKREIITSNSELKTEHEMAYSFLEFDMKVYEDVLPSLVPYGFFIKPQVEFNTSVLFFVVQDFKRLKNINSSSRSIIPENLFAYFYLRGKIEEVNLNELLIFMIKRLEQKGYAICDKIIALPLIDANITNISIEQLYEIQIPVKKM